MPQCPQCNKSLADLSPTCPSCQADLDLLVEYVGQMKLGLQKADDFTRSGELGKAMWAYLAVLEIDPNNPEARRQVGQVTTAVRQFDRTAPNRRWLPMSGNHAPQEGARPSRRRWIWRSLWLLAVVLAFALGILIGGQVGLDNGGEQPSPKPAKPKDTLTG